MLTISKPLSARQAQTYHTEEFTAADQMYYSQSNQLHGEWQGKLAEAWNLTGEVKADDFEKLANGLHPQTGAPVVRQREGYLYKNDRGEFVKAMEHRAGWDATFSAPKSVSLTALVGEDHRVREAHRESVRVALNELEVFVQARIGSNHPAETMGRWIVAKFEHDSARPVNGYAAPQLHTHCVFFNVTQTKTGETRALQPQELYRSQRFAKAVYQSELGNHLRQLGYEIEMGKNGASEIKGYSREYLEASSPRRQQIEAHLREEGRRGAGAAEIAAHRTREPKQKMTAEVMLARHQDIAAPFGHQAERVVAQAKQNSSSLTPETSQDSRKFAHHAVTFARDKQTEREAVFDERDLLADALKRSLGQCTLKEIRENFESRKLAGEFIEGGMTSIGRTFTTREMMEIETENIRLMLEGQQRFHEPIASEHSAKHRLALLSDDQRHAVSEILASQDQIVGLQGTAGAGKTTALRAIRAAAERQGFQVEGFAPTSGAAQQLEEAGIRSRTLQHYLAQGPLKEGGKTRLYFVDESSLAGSKQVNEFLYRLHAQDRVILVGDTHQHQGVEAGRPFEQLQQAGMRTAQLNRIIRQREPELKQTVEQLARGQVREAVERLSKSGRVKEIPDREARMTAIARDYSLNPQGTLVISPDNRSRMALNERIHKELQSNGAVQRREYRVTVLVPDPHLTGADRQWAGCYDDGNVVRYTTGSKALKLRAGEYVRVMGSDLMKNLVTVRRTNGKQLTYDPARLQGVSVYQEVERNFAVGDRIQFTAPYRNERIANRQLGTIQDVRNRTLTIRLDSGRTVTLSLRKQPHIDYGYAVTSHSSQGLTADRVLVNVDTTSAREKLLNTRFAYVAISRARLEAKIYTDDAESMHQRLSHEVSKSSANEISQRQPNQLRQESQRQKQSQGLELSL